MKALYDATIYLLFDLNTRMALKMRNLFIVCTRQGISIFVLKIYGRQKPYSLKSLRSETFSLHLSVPLRQRYTARAHAMSCVLGEYTYAPICTAIEEDDLDSVVDALTVPVKRPSLPCRVLCELCASIGLMIPLQVASPIVALNELTKSTHLDPYTKDQFRIFTTSSRSCFM